MESMSPEAFEALCRQVWGKLSQRLNKPMTFTSNEEYFQELEDAGAYRDVLIDNFDQNTNEYSLQAKACIQELEWAGVNLDDYPEQDRHRLLQEVMRQAYMAIDRHIESITYNFKNPKRPKSAYVDVATKPSYPIEAIENSINTPSILVLDDLYREFLTYKLQHGLTKSMKDSYGRYYAYVSHVLGQKPIDEVTSMHLKKCLIGYGFLPRRNMLPYNKMSNEQLFDNKDSQLIPAADRVSTKTVADVKKMIQGIFAYAVENELLKASPASKIMNKNATSNEKTRGAYDAAQIRTLLAAAKAQEEPWKKWVVLFAIYTGARANEIIQLRKQDYLIDQESGIPYFFLSDTAGATKTKAAQRIVPVHDALLAEGLLDFIDSSATNEVFPDVRNSKKVSAWYPRFRQAAGVSKVNMHDEDLVFHSFRHSFITRARGAGVNDIKLFRVVGHETKKAAITDRYTGHFTVAQLKEVVDAVKY